MNKYWFRKRRGLWSKDLGWGWMPITWEGYVVVGLFFILIGVVAHSTGMLSGEVSLAAGFMFLAAVLILISFAAIVSRVKTEQ